MKKQIKAKKPVKKMKTTKTKIKKIPKKTKDKINAIRKNMLFADLLNKHPETAEVLFESGLHCIGCGGAMYETIEQGCLAHGFSRKQIDDLMTRLNKKLNKVSSICKASNSRGKSYERIERKVKRRKPLVSARVVA